MILPVRLIKEIVHCNDYYGGCHGLGIADKIIIRMLEIRSLKLKLIGNIFDNC